MVSDGKRGALPFSGNVLVAAYLQRVGTLFVIAGLSSLSFGKDFRDYLNFSFIVVLYGLVAVMVGPVVFHAGHIRTIALRILGVSSEEESIEKSIEKSIEESSTGSSSREGLSAGERKAEFVKKRENSTLESRFLCEERAEGISPDLDISPDTMMLLADGVGEEFRELFSPAFLREEASMNAAWRQKLLMDRREGLGRVEDGKLASFEPSFFDLMGGGEGLAANSTVFPAVTPTKWPELARR